MPQSAASETDFSNHWIPFTPNRDFRKEPKMFARAEGVYYYDMQGRPVLDGASGLFTTPAGHGRKEIAEAVYKQLLELDFSSSFQRSHPKAFELAGRLAKLMPAGLDKIFFVNSGSEAVDTAMKICLAYHKAKGTLDETPVKFDLERHRAAATPLRFPGKLLADAAYIRGPALVVAGAEDPERRRELVHPVVQSRLVVVGLAVVAEAAGELDTLLAG